jgi:hypothetical protein
VLYSFIKLCNISDPVVVAQQWADADELNCSDDDMDALSIDSGPGEDGFVADGYADLLNDIEESHPTEGSFCSRPPQHIIL